MACGCTTTTCLSVKFDPCSEGAELLINAAYTGDMRGEIEFNGLWTEFSVGVTATEAIIIPTSLLNEYYTHTLKLYDEAGTLVNNTCYAVNAKAMVGAGDFPVQPAGEVIEVFDVTITEAGSSVEDAKFADGTIMLLGTDGQSYNRAFFSKPFSSDTLTSTTLSFYVDQIVTVTLKR